MTCYTPLDRILIYKEASLREGIQTDKLRLSIQRAEWDWLCARFGVTTFYTSSGTRRVAGVNIDILGEQKS